MFFQLLKEAEGGPVVIYGSPTTGKSTFQKTVAEGHPSLKVIDCDDYLDVTADSEVKIEGFLSALKEVEDGAADVLLTNFILDADHPEYERYRSLISVAFFRNGGDTWDTIASTGLEEKFSSVGIDRDRIMGWEDGINQWISSLRKDGTRVFKLGVGSYMSDVLIPETDQDVRL